MNLMGQQFDVVVIGAGQAGLASGWYLKQQGLNFMLLDEQRGPGGNWHNYYDSLKLFSPAAYSALPGMPFPGTPGHYPGRDEVVRYLEQYADRFQLPVRQGVRVTRVMGLEQGFQITTACGEYCQARAVIVASGAFSRPYLPDIPGREDFNGTQLHSADYRHGAPFRGQRVVVIGAANSAVQIAHDLAAVAEVTLATRDAIRFAPPTDTGGRFSHLVEMDRPGENPLVERPEHPGSGQWHLSQGAEKRLFQAAPHVHPDHLNGCRLGRWTA